MLKMVHLFLIRLKENAQNVKKIKDYGNEVIIFFNDHIATRIYKDAFTEGSWEECNALLQSKIK